MLRNPFDSDDMEQTMSRTEDSAERGLVKRDTAGPVTYDELGHNDELDQRDGDIADEGMGHRG